MGKLYRKPHSYKRKKSILKNRFFWLGVLITVFFAGLLYFLFFSEFFQIEKVIVTGEEKLSKEDIRSFIPAKNIFLVNLKEIRKNILNEFPRIAKVEVRRSFPDSINVQVVERQGQANWCRGEKCFLLGEEGIIFEEIQLREDLVKIVDQQSTAPNYLGEKVMEEEDLNKILDIDSRLKTDFKIPLSEFIVVDQDKLIANVEEGWQINFTLQKDLEWQLTKLAAVLETKIPLEARDNLEYIELRFGNFAPYKYKD